MKLYVWREFHGDFECIGSIYDKEDEIAFAYEDSYLESPNAAPLSLSLPLSSTPHCGPHVRCYFEGLIPEGATRRLLSSGKRWGSHSYMDVLEKLNLECIGAVALTRSQGVDIRAHERYIPLKADKIEYMLEHPVERSAKMLEESRLSLAGAQSKIGVYIDEAGEMYLPEGSAPSTHIIKIASKDYDMLAANEAVCQIIADTCGLESALPDRVYRFENERIYTSKRFDRILDTSERIVSGLPAPWRRHQEDFSQAGVIPLYAKYEPTDAKYYNVMAALLEANSRNPYGERAALLRLAYFDYLIGNCDNHIKNFSILYDNDWRTIELSPAYDLVCTAIYSGLSKEMGIAMGGVKRIDVIDREELLATANDVGIAQNMAKSIFAEVAEGIRGGMADAIDRATNLGYTNAEEVAQKIMASAESRMRTL